MKTYDEILNSMKNTYFEESGSAVEDNSQTLKLLEIVASELYGLSCYADWALKQNFVQTANGEYLERLAELRGCVRKLPSKAKGRLRFSISEPIDEDFEIPMGTVCSADGFAYIQFATDEKAVINAGETQVVVDATAIDYGKKYNVNENTITVMVNAPIGVFSVTNDEKFVGGYDGENDNELRERVIKNYNIAPNGINNTSLENQVLLLDYVYDCHIPYAQNAGEMIVYVATSDGALTDTQREEIINQLPVARLMGVDVDIRLATVKVYDLTVFIDNDAGFYSKELSETIKSLVFENVSYGKIGQAISLSQLSKKIFALDGVRDVFFISDSIAGNQVCCDKNQILSLNEVKVEYANGTL